MELFAETLLLNRYCFDLHYCYFTFLSPYSDVRYSYQEVPLQWQIQGAPNQSRRQTNKIFLGNYVKLKRNWIVGWGRRVALDLPIFTQPAIPFSSLLFYPYKCNFDGAHDLNFVSLFITVSCVLRIGESLTVTDTFLGTALLVTLQLAVDQSVVLRATFTS